MVFRYCFGMTMSVSTLMIFRGAATPSSVVNFSIDALPVGKLRGSGRSRRLFIANRSPFKGPKNATLACGSLDRLHIGVGEAEMVADFVDQHVPDNVAECLLMFGPV